MVELGGQIEQKYAAHLQTAEENLSPISLHYNYCQMNSLVLQLLLYVTYVYHKLRSEIFPILKFMTLNWWSTFS